MYYSIRHLTKFRYSSPVSESIMEARMQPRSEGPQRCLSFQLAVHPRRRVYSYRDYLGNTVHHFDVPGHHRQLILVAEALVDVQAGPALPESLANDAWDALDATIAAGDFIEMLLPSQFGQSSELLEQLARELGVESREHARARDPLMLVLQLSSGLYGKIAYVPKSTRVDSPIDDALRTRQGVCQDFAHILIALTRRIGIPCRYVSGYLFHRAGDKTRSAEGATHAWVEVLLPTLGWVGFDPTNNVLAGEMHVRTAVGRDYADVPPTRGVFKGSAESQLQVAVRVAPSDAPPPLEAEPGAEDWSNSLREETADNDSAAQQQQQQQQ
ncbi:MAG TPA: transglutaminase family protein [Bryobacteraceae bacterium]|nr:transglutaminase family protein [Bryobacteraceae bacterium]